MGCCGQKRSQPVGMARGAPMGAAPASRPGAGAGVGVGMWPSPGSSIAYAQATLQGARSVTLRLRERARVVVRGPVTGRAYAFGTEGATQPVDARDAEALLRTRRFERA